MRNALVIVCALAVLAGAGPALGGEGDFYWACHTGDGNWDVVANWEVLGYWDYSGDDPIWVVDYAPATTLPTSDKIAFGNVTDPGLGLGVYTITINTPVATAARYYSRDDVGTLADESVLLLEAGGTITVPVMWIGGDVEGTNRCVFRMTGGTANIGGRIASADKNGHVEISGGTVLPGYYVHSTLGITSAGWYVGNTTDEREFGSVSVLGSASSITTYGGESVTTTAFCMRNMSTLIAELDAGGVSTISSDMSQSLTGIYRNADNMKFYGDHSPVIDMQRQLGIIPDKDEVFVLIAADYIYQNDAGGGVGLVLSPDDVGTWEMTIELGTESWVEDGFNPGVWLPRVNNGDNASVSVKWMPSFPGDANADGEVDVGDLGILAGNYGETSMVWKYGDFNGDGLVDVGDLGILAGNYGSTSVIPEPATMVLLGLGAVAMIRRRRVA